MSEKQKITKIEQQKRNKKRYNIYIDDEYAFAVHEDVLIANRLLKDKEVDRENLNLLLQEEEKNKVWQKALHYISYKPRTESEVKRYLMIRGFEPEIISDIIKKLKDEHLLNDHLYIEQYIEERIKFRPRGKKLIEYELKNRGLNINDIQKGLDKIDEETEYQLAMDLVRKKKRQLQGLDREKLNQKLGSYLYRKGIAYEVIRKILEVFDE